jgi:pentatricopeptide repeat protein
MIATKLLRPVGTFLALNKPKHAYKKLLDRMARARQYRRDAIPYMYRTAVGAFLRRRYTTEALDLMKLMEAEGVHPTMPLRALLDVNVVAKLDPTNFRSMREVLRPYITADDFTPTDMKRLLVILATELSWEIKHLSPVLFEFLDAIKTRGDIDGQDDDLHWIVQAATLLQDRPDAWYQAMRALVADMGVQKEQPFSKMLRTMPRWADAEEIIGWMASEKIRPNSVTFGALMRAQVTRGQYDRALALYYFIVGGHAGETVVLTAEGASAMYRMMQLIAIKRGRGLRRSKQFPGAMDVPTPRRLFAEMIRAHARLTGGKTTTLSHALKTQAINAAIRELMRRRDYIGAFIALRTFAACHLLPNFATYSHIVAFLRTRLMAAFGAATNQDHHWLEAMLAPLQSELAGFVHRAPKLLLTYLLLRLGESQDRKDSKRPKMDPTIPPEDVPPSTSIHGFIPSPMQLVGILSLPEVRLWDLNPLLGMLRRAAAADLKSGSFSERNSQTFAAIAAAKKEMLPVVTRLEHINKPRKTDHRKYRGAMFRVSEVDT